MPLDLGARVRQGAVVAEIESLELGRAREEFLKELDALRAATRVYERAKVLVGGKAISAGEFQTREGDYLARRAAAEAAERALHLLGDADARDRATSHGRRIGDGRFLRATHPGSRCARPSVGASSTAR